MTITLEQLNCWLAIPREGEHLEFKEAKNHYDFEKLVQYCVALANEGGGKIILGVTDKLPRRIVGSRAFTNLQRTKAGLIERLHLRIEAEELTHSQGRVVVFHVPPRPIGMPVHYKKNASKKVNHILIFRELMITRYRLRFGVKCKILYSSGF